MKYRVNVIVPCVVEATDADDAHDKALVLVMCHNRCGKIPEEIGIADAEVIEEIKED